MTNLPQIDPRFLREISKRLEQDWSEYFRKKTAEALINVALFLLMLATVFAIAYPIVMILGDAA